jgi:hypothetical protein
MHHQRPSHPVPNVRDDRETPLCVGQDGALIILIWVKLERKCFYKQDWTAQISLIPLNKLHLARRANLNGPLFTCLREGLRDQYTAVPERDGFAALGIAGAATDGGGVGVAVAGAETHLLRRQASSAKLACPRTETYSLR